MFKIQHKRLFDFRDLKFTISNLFRISDFGFRAFPRRGFTIIETLVAIAILLLSIIAPLTIAEKGLAGAEAARKEIVAFYLAQEAIEYVRNVRDTNAIAGRTSEANWLQGLGECRRDEGCGIDPTAPSGIQAVWCGTSSDMCVLSQYTGDIAEQRGLFGHRPPSQGWVKTDITRRVFVRTIQLHEAKVQVDLSWTAGSLGPRTMSVSENLLNWYNSP